ncbi:PKD domain-containing protein [Methanogenium cariaci]|uniref:PKD domain-containing protein n=1 Tax=Methanogenium cariaci TaxID=2197 RepID=UPI000783B282|nr:PKD domain-containing protein [Methanogenium cariaci]
MFADLSTNSPDSYDWDFGDGERSPEQSPSHIYQEAGLYPVSLTVQRNGIPQTETKTGYIHVLDAVSLGDAVDAPELAWTTGGNKEWASEIGADYVNSSSARSGGGVLSSHQNSWMQTSVTGPGTLTFDWEANPGKMMGMPFGDLVFSMDNAGQYDDGYKMIKYPGWHHETYKIGNGVHTLNWTYSTRTTDKEENGGWLDNVSFVYGVDEPVANFSTNVTEECGFAPLAVQFTDTSTEFPIAWNWDFGDGETSPPDENPVHTYTEPKDYTITLTVENIEGTGTVTKTLTVLEPISIGEALDAEELDWSTGGGDAEWYTDLYTSVAGGSSGHNGIIGSNADTTWVQANITGPGVLTYDWKISSSSTTYDGQIEFSVNGDVKKSIKGKQNYGDWTREYFEIPTGAQTLRWDYTNDYYFTPPDHCGNLDNVTYTFGAINPTAEFDANEARGMAPASITFTDISAGCPTSWAWDFGDNTTSDKQNPVHNYTKAGGSYPVTLTVTNDAGSDSAEQIIEIVPYTTIGQALDADDLNWTTGGDNGGMVC